MLSCTRWLKVGYLVALSTVLVLLLSKPEPAQAQRSIAYAFLPGAGTNQIGMLILAGQSGPFSSYNQAISMLTQAGQALDSFGVGQTGGMGLLGGMGMGGGGLGGGGLGGGGLGGLGGMMGMGGMGGMGGLGGMMGAGGMGMGGNRGMGGMGGFAGKGFGGFNGKKPL